MTGGDSAAEERGTDETDVVDEDVITVDLHGELVCMSGAEEAKHGAGSGNMAFSSSNNTVGGLGPTGALAKRFCPPERPILAISLPQYDAISFDAAETKLVRAGAADGPELSFGFCS